MKNYQTYLFDLDGTLISTIDLICNCFKFSLQKYLGRVFPQEEVLLQIGLPLKKQFIHFIESIGGDPNKFDLNQMAKDHMDYQMQIWQDHVRAYDHALEVLALLKKKKKKLGIVTSRLSPTTDLYLKHTGLHPYLDCIITPESTHNHKPHPEPILTAIEKLGGKNTSTVMIGDSLFDIKCGREARVDTIWMVHPDCPWTMKRKKLDESEPGQLAITIITDLRDILRTGI